MLAAALLVFAATQPAEYRRRLRDVFRSLRTSHGGPAFVNNNQLADLETEAQSRLDRACALDQSDGAYLRTCDWVMSQLRDPYAAHLPPARTDAVYERYHGRVGLGLRLGWRLRRDSALRWRRCATVLSVDACSPAERAGVRVGDEVVEVGGEGVRGARLAATVRRLEDGAEGTSVELTLRRENGGGDNDAPHPSTQIPAAAAPSAEAATTTVEVRRQLLPKPTVVSRALDGAGAHVLRISSFGTRTAAEVRAELRRLRRARAAGAPPPTLVLDLRDNDGGLLPAAVAVARMLVPARGTPPLLAMCKQRAAAPEAEAVTAPEVEKAFHRRWYHRAPLGVAAPLVVVLVNGATVSAAEVLAAALRGAGRAVIVGEGTYGKGATQALVYQRDGCALLFTAYTLHSGGAPLTRGVAPHVRWHFGRGDPERLGDAEIGRVLKAAEQHRARALSE